MMETELKKGTINCPCHKERMSFEQLHGTRIVRDGFLSARCEKSKKYFKIRSELKIT